MADTTGKNLKEPNQVDWDKVGGSTFQPPPQAKVNGQWVVLYGQLPTVIKVDPNTDVTEEGYRVYNLDPIKLVKNGPGIDGYQIRFSSTTLKPFKNNSNATAILLKAAGVTAKPQKTTEYDSVIKMVAGKVVPLTIDWSAKNKDNGEAIYGYDNFPDDPQRPGQKKAVLKQGDTYLDSEGNLQTVKSEVLFANARLRFFEAKGK